jgi:hypothetical protein
MNKCTSCGAEIFWVRLSSRSRIPLNAKSEIRFVRIGTSADQFKSISVFKSHFATCPDAELYRKSTCNCDAQEHDGRHGLMCEKNRGQKTVELQPVEARCKAALNPFP